MIGGLVMTARESKEQLDDRLVHLFRNRAQLKKAHHDLQTKLRTLEEKLKNAEASSRRAEERLEAIERLMAKPQAGYNGLVYFQLRALWRGCNEQLQTFAAQLRRQQEDRERKKQVQRFKEDRQHRMEEVNDLLGRVKEEADGLAEEIVLAEDRHGRLKGPWNFFRRRRLGADVAERRGEHAAARARLEELFDRRLKIESEPPPEFAGLSIEGKRVINIAVIAYAHFLYGHFSEGDLARLSREAVTRPIQDLKYGSEDECISMIDRIQKLMRGLTDSHTNAASLRRLAQEIRSHAEFRTDQESTPTASSLDGMMMSSTVPGARANVLTDEYWDLYEIFLR